MSRIVLQSDIDQQYQKTCMLTDNFGSLAVRMVARLIVLTSSFKKCSGQTTIISACRLQAKNLMNVTDSLKDCAELLRISKDTMQNLDATIRQEINNQDLMTLNQLSYGDTTSNQIVANQDGTHVVVINGVAYHALNYEPNILSQNDYDGECFGYGFGNEGCTATAWCMGLSMITGKSYNPTDSQMWTNGIGATFEGQGGSVWGGQSEMLAEAYNQIQNGKPSLFYAYHSFTDGGSMHAVTIVGVSETADINNLKMSDFLVVDPWGGEVKSLDQVNYTSYPDGSRLITYGSDLP